MSDLIERLRKLVVLDEVGSNNNLANEAADEIERLTKENEELRNELQQALHDLMVRETAKDEEIAALKAKQESAEQPVAWEYRTYNAETDVVYYHVTQSWLEAKNYDQFPAPLYYNTTPTAAIEDFKRRAVEACMNKAKSVTQLNFAGGCEWCAEAIEALPLIEEK